MSKKIRLYVFFVVLCFVSPIHAQKSLDPKALYNNGITLLARGDVYKAIDALRDAITINPAYADAWAALAKCQYELHEYEQGIAFTKEAFKYGPRLYSTLNLQAFCLIALGSLKEARDIFAEVLATRPNDTDARFGLALLDIHTGRSIEAKTKLQASLKASPGDPRALLSLALIAKSEGRSSEAMAYAQEAIKRTSGDANLYYVASILYAEKGLALEAARLAQLAIDTKPMNNDARKLLALIYYERGQYSEARSILEDAIRNNREDASAWFVLGLVESATSKFNEALYAFNAICKMRPDDEIARIALENHIMDSTTFEAPIRTDYASWRFERAAMFERQYLYEKAISEYRRGLEIAPYSNQGRRRYAELIRLSGLPSTYLHELQFLSSIGKADQALNDAIEIYTSLLTNAVGRDWKVDSLFNASVPYRITVYSQGSGFGLLHYGSNVTLAEYLHDALAFEPGLSVNKLVRKVSSLAEAQKLSRDNNDDYFVLIDVAESEREIVISMELRVANSGALVLATSAVRSGNDKVAMAISQLAKNVRQAIPVRGLLLARRSELGLIDLGRVDGIKKGDELLIIKNGAVKIKSNGLDLSWNESDIVATLTIERVDDEFSEGRIKPQGFIDRVNYRDVVVFKNPPKTQPAAPALQTPNMQNITLFDKMLKIVF